MPLAKLGKLLGRADVCGSTVLFRRERDDDGSTFLIYFLEMYLLEREGRTGRGKRESQANSRLSTEPRARRGAQSPDPELRT